jgi:hypothetical protein
VDCGWIRDTGIPLFYYLLVDVLITMQNGGVIRLRAPRGVLAEWKAEGGHP